MALKIEELRKAKDGAMYRSPARLYVTADDRLCDGQDPEAVKLLVGEGCEISNAEAAKYGLIAGAEPADDEAQEEGLEANTVAELRELAEERGVELSARASKADIIDALEEGEGAAEGSEDGDE